MSTRTFKLGAALLALATLSGCATSGWRADSSFGNSVRATTASQIIDPSAVRNTSTVAGIDGRAARAAQARYEASFAQPAPAEAALTTGAIR